MLTSTFDHEFIVGFYADSTDTVSDPFFVTFQHSDKTQIKIHAVNSDKESLIFTEEELNWFFPNFSNFKQLFEAQKTFDVPNVKYTIPFYNSDYDATFESVGDLLYVYLTSVNCKQKSRSRLLITLNDVTSIRGKFASFKELITIYESFAKT